MKTNKLILSLTLAAFSFVATAQVKVGDNPTTIDADAVLEMETTDKGMLMPRVDLTATTAAGPLSAHVEGMTVYNTATAGDVTPGYYYNDGTKWVRMADDANVAAADLTDDAWINNPGASRVELGTLSDDTTVRPVGTEFVVDDNGNIGLGTTDLNPFPFSMNRHITLKGAPNQGAHIQFLGDDIPSGTNTLGMIRAGNIFGGTNTYLGQYGLFGGANSSQFSVVTSELGVSGERMRIRANGNVGIGTAVPTLKLDVAGKTRVRDLTGTDAATDVIVTADATTGELKEAGTIAAAVAANEPWFGEDDNMGATLNTENIYSMGNVGIGTATPATNLQVSSSTGGIIRSTFTGLGGRHLDFKHVGTSASINNSVAVRTNLQTAGVDIITYNSDPAPRVTINGSQLVNTLSVNGNQAIGAGYFDEAAPANGMIVEGNVGIGTTAPSDRLTVFDDIATGQTAFFKHAVPTTQAVVFGNEASLTDDTGLYFRTTGIGSIKTASTGNLQLRDGTDVNVHVQGSNGYVGIGRENPTEKLAVAGNIQAAGVNSYLHVISHTTVTAEVQALAGYSTFGNNSNHDFRLVTGNVDRVHVDHADGFVGIGNINPSQRLDVTGNILASGTITPDYVFQNYYNTENSLKPSYKMMNLEEVEAFVKANNHLPGVFSSKEVKENGGVLVNRATEQNLEKVEELFLHTIEQEKKIDTLTKENESLKLRLAKIEAALNLNKK